MVDNTSVEDTDQDNLVNNPYFIRNNIFQSIKAMELFPKPYWYANSFKIIFLRWHIWMNFLSHVKKCQLFLIITVKVLSSYYYKSLECHQFFPFWFLLISQKKKFYGEETGKYGECDIIEMSFPVILGQRRSCMKENCNKEKKKSIIIFLKDFNVFSFN